MRTKGDMIVYALEHTKDKDLLGSSVSRFRGGTIRRHRRTRASSTRSG